MGQNPIPLVNIKIAGKWMFIPLKMVLIGIDPYPFHQFHPGFAFNTEAASALHAYRETRPSLHNCNDGLLASLCWVDICRRQKKTLGIDFQIMINPSIIHIYIHIIECISGWWFQTRSIFHFLYGMSSFPLTNSIIFQDGFSTTNQIIDPLFMVKLVQPPFFIGK